MSVIRPRKKYFIKPGFQSKLTAIMILLVIIAANLVGGLTYCFAQEKLKALFDEYKVPISMEQITRILLPCVLVSEIIGIFLVGLLCIKLTHIIAGPVYRMERVCRGIGEGDLTNFIKLRKNDELKELADSINEMTLGLRNKVINIKDNYEELKGTLDASRASIPSNKVDDIFTKLESIEGTIQSFILEKERLERIEDEEESDNKEEAEKNEVAENKDLVESKETKELTETTETKAIEEKAPEKQE